MPVCGEGSFFELFSSLFLRNIVHLAVYDGCFNIGCRKLVSRLQLGVYL